jgi:branched-chain amino acid aminotransferase
MATFLAKNIKNKASPIKTTLPSLKGVGFGTLFAPHQIHIDWTKKDGWKDPEIIDFAPLTLPIQASSLHYGLQCFEGLKAYYAPKDKSLRIFRPDMNAKRMQTSMHSMGFPSFDEKEWVEVLKELVRTNKDFVPREEGYTLYLRPSCIATNDTLKVGPADAAKLFMIASPVGPYYATGFKPVKLWVDRVHKRAWPGGSGQYKVGGNYAPTIGHQVEASARGYQQILWLGPHEEVSEVGAMNFMMMWKNAKGERELITPPLDGTILPGVTRDSILSLARKWGEFKVTEGNFTLTEVAQALQEKRVEEMFGCGTGAIVTSVDCLDVDDGRKFTVPVPEKGIAVRALNELSDIQYGRTDSPWSVVV